MAMTAQLWLISGLATELRLDRRTIAAKLRAVPSDCQVPGRAAWLMSTAVRAIYQGGGEKIDLNAERARLAKEQADGQALRNAVARGELLPADNVVAGWEQAIGRARGVLLGIPTSSAARIVLLSRQHEDAKAAERAVRELLVSLIDTALNELANTEFEDDAEPEAIDA